MPWYALHTKPRNEKKVAAELNKKGYLAYCPVVETIRQWSDRKKKVEIPMLSSYIFVKKEENIKEHNLLIPGTLRILMIDGKPAIISDKEIEMLQNFGRGTFHQITMENIQVGDKITIPSGMFKDFEGVVHQTSSNKLTIILPNMGLKVTLEK